MKHILDYIKECLITEGGNAVKAEPIPAVIAPKVYDEIEKKVHSISKFKDIDMAALGSIGKKADDQTNGDIDVAVRVDTKDELNEIVDTCFKDCEINFDKDVFINNREKYSRNRVNNDISNIQEENDSNEITDLNNNSKN